MTRFLLIRHATTDAVGQRFSGRLPGVLLNAEGQAQAQQLAGRLAEAPLDAVYSSPLERALQTAKPLAATHHLMPVVEEAFIELNLGEWTNKTFQELHDDPQFHLFNSFRGGTRIPGGELMLEAQARMVAGLQRLAGQHPYQTVAVVSHSDLIKAAVAYYAGSPLDLFQRLEISPASVSILEIYAESARLIALNSTPELRW
jgi:broad specificity phosphatase PhoE